MANRNNMNKQILNVDQADEMVSHFLFIFVSCKVDILKILIKITSYTIKLSLTLLIIFKISTQIENFIPYTKFSLRFSSTTNFASETMYY